MAEGSTCVSLQDPSCVQTPLKVEPSEDLLWRQSFPFGFCDFKWQQLDTAFTFIHASVDFLM